MAQNPSDEREAEDRDVLPSDELRAGDASPPTDDPLMVPGAADIQDLARGNQSDESEWARVEGVGE